MGLLREVMVCSLHVLYGRGRVESESSQCVWSLFMRAFRDISVEAEASLSSAGTAIFIGKALPSDSPTKGSPRRAYSGDKRQRPSNTRVAFRAFRLAVDSPVSNRNLCNCNQSSSRRTGVLLRRDGHRAFRLNRDI